MFRAPDDRAPRRVLVPHSPVLVAGFREVLWLDPDGEIEALAPADARGRVERETPMLCHGPATARRLDVPGFRAIAEVMDRAGWLWGPAVLAALPPAEAGAVRKAAGLRAWVRLDEWSEPAPQPPP